MLLLVLAARAQDRAELYRAAHEGADRADLLAKWGKLAGNEAQAMVRMYRSLLREDKEFAEPEGDVQKLPAARQAAYWTYRLRDAALTRIRSRYQPPMFIGWPEGNAVDKLTDLGWDAIPPLIEHLDDPRPTRSAEMFSGVRDDDIQRLFSHGDLCRMVLHTITGEWLYTTHGARLWWKRQKALGAERFFLDRFENSSAKAVALSHLARMDPDKYLPRIVESLAELEPRDAYDVLERIQRHFSPRHKRAHRMLMRGDDVHKWAVATSLAWKHYKSDASAGALVALMRKKPDDHGVYIAVERLAEVATVPARKLLLGLVTEKHERLREAVVSHIARDLDLFEELLGIAEGDARLGLARGVAAFLDREGLIDGEPDIKRLVEWMRDRR